MMGASIRYCLITLQWSGNTTTCDPMTCTTPSLPENVSLTRPCIGKYNTSCSIVCRSGYKLVGSSTLKCVFNDMKRVVEWSSASAPSCKSELVLCTLDATNRSKVHLYVGQN